MRRYLFRICEKWTRSPAILPIALVYLFIGWIRNLLYDAGWFKETRVNVPVLSVGNISLGGSGKTPLVILLANHFASRRVAVLSRGYGDGDELSVIEQRCPHVKIYAGKNRVLLAKRAAKEGAELILLDDGFQHRRLARDWDIVLLDPTARFLREGKGRLKKASLLASFFDGAAPVEFCLHPLTPIEKGKRAAIFCGIANPARFKRMVIGLGVEVAGCLFLGDHEPARLEKLKQLLDETRVKILLCTEKDWVKLPPNDLPIEKIPVEAVLLKGGGPWQAFLAKIEEKIDNHTRYDEGRFNNSFTEIR